MSKFVPSPQQSDLFEFIKNGQGSCVLQAVAGSGKTTTVIHGIELMTGSIFFGAYNKKIADEIKLKAPVKNGLVISTMHAAGLNAFRKMYKNFTVNENKNRDLYRSLFGSDVAATRAMERLILVP